MELDEKDEYFEMFAYAGWTHVCSDYNMHIFKANKGTTPIYSDTESSKEKIVRSAIPVQTIVIYSVAVTFALWLTKTFTYGIVHTISTWAFALSFAITIPSIMTLVATYYHRLKKINKRSWE
ncbi:DUF2812 domain-containing protein [Sporosarcina thermotolerans]|uniref:DUF2812 domain-containing protein n=1 Tax=Sporosarcina thermotolerans TaxID=633404 RepID=UPI0024BCF727|nr:DUF2812 domain-containing protein [Sporosarcina thermotolerans]WHT48606.1 DUF2812 domain-containing protein [Sporosarcina thermotolerans]